MNNYEGNKYRNSYEGGHNSFSPILDYAKFYKCYKYGHKSRECKSSPIMPLKKNKQE